MRGQRETLWTETVLKAPATGDAGLEGLRESGTLRSTEPHCHRGPRMMGSSSPTPGRASRGGRSPPRQRRPGSRDPSVCPRRRVAARSPPRCCRRVDAAWSLPSKPFHGPHAVLPAAAAVRSTEPPALPSSCQHLPQQVAGSGSGQPCPEAETLPSRCLEADWVPPPLLPPGGIQEALTGESAGKAARMRP